jgi:type II secretory ATPase GspE/PulE/Tfp pilus assembly ATPase PilB-like protein
MPKKKPVSTTTKTSKKNVTDDTTKDDYYSPQAKFSQKMSEISIREKEVKAAEDAQRLGLQYIDLLLFPVTPEALKMLPEEEARKNKVVCFFNEDKQVRLGALEMNDQVSQIVSLLEEDGENKVEVYIISEHSLERVFKLYANLPIIKPVNKEINITDEELEKFGVGISSLSSLQEKFKNVSTTDVLSLLVASALKVNSSDIHVEAEENGVVVRYRIDGVLHDVAQFPKDHWKQFISRIKLLAALKINVTDRPQDGRVTLRLASGSLDVRVSTLPTAWGESVVMRILHSGTVGVTFDQLGLRGATFLKLKKEVERPNGMIITTGPTGSGKTTSMYAILRTLNKPGVKIITLEDPIEIKMDGINQSQVDPYHDYTFSKGLRSILRQDPDICMVGEIRDLETAEIAIQMALTGHLMLSTIHTNSASGVIPRFLSMGVKPFLLAPSLNSVIGQRLVRRICENCREETTLSKENEERVRSVLETLPEDEKKNVDFNKLQFYKGKGCEACSGLGYKGRIGIYEIFIMNKEIEAVILSSTVSEYVIQDIATKGGMVTMVQDGLLKALDKITSVEEVFRVIE